jgi:hypothetical protein
MSQCEFYAVIIAARRVELPSRKSRFLLGYARGSLLRRARSERRVIEPQREQSCDVLIASRT